jgi:predicted nucleotidyltransferase
MDRQELVEALRALDRRLASSVDIVVVGGAAMILHFGAPRATRDVDMLLLRGDSEELRGAIRDVARELHLPKNWMSDAAKAFADVLPPDFYHRLVQLDLSLEHLRLYALGRPDQVAMKAIALREPDLEDLELLLPGLSEADRSVVVDIVHHVARVRPDWAQKLRYFLLEQGWQIE